MYDTEYLAHHGVKGMRWGVRRYQNSDGTLTKAGRHKQYKENVKAARKEYNKKVKESGLYKEVFKIKNTSILRSRLDAAKKEKIIDDWAIKKANELFDQYKDMKIKDLSEKGKEIKPLVQKYFFDYLPSTSGSFGTADYALRSYVKIYDPTDNTTKTEKRVSRYRQY